jgi:hypothetical protein
MLMSQTEYGAHRSAKGLSGATQSSVSQAIKQGRISYAPGTTLIDPEEADVSWRQRTEPRPQFPNAPRQHTKSSHTDYTDAEADAARARFAARQLELVNPADVLQALYDAYRIITAEYHALCCGLAGRTEVMTVRELDQAMDALVERLGDALCPAIHLAFTGEVDG